MSITLTNQEQFLVGVTAVETNAVAGVTSFSVDYLNNQLTVNLQTGSIVNGSITPSQKGTRQVVTINLSTGAWSVNGQQVSTLGAVALTSVNTVLKNIRNQLETGAVALGTISGVQIPWS